MGLDQWLTLIISLILSGVGIRLAYKSDISLTKIEQQNKHFDETMRKLVDRLVQAQIDLLSVTILGKSPDTKNENEKEDILLGIERLKKEVLEKRD